MKNLEDILKGILGFIQYWESLKIADVGGSCWHRYGSWIHYWTRVRAALADLHQDSPHTLRHGFWPQTRVNVQASEASLLGNGEVREYASYCISVDLSNWLGRYYKKSKRLPIEL